MRPLTAASAKKLGIPPRTGRRLTLWLFDYDGTLAPLASHPDVVRFPAEARRLLERLRHRPASVVGVVSGRERADLEKQIAMPELIYGGNHGWEIRGPNGLRFDHPAQRRWRPVIRQLVRTLRRTLRSFGGVWVEDKGFTLSVHYRQAVASTEPKVKKILDELVSQKKFRPIEVVHGKKIFDLRPRVRWHKGRAVTWIRRKMKGDPVVVYAGDDATDEDAFRTLRKSDIGVRVGVGKTAARYFVKTPEDLVGWFHRWLDAEDTHGS